MAVAACGDGRDKPGGPSASTNTGDDGGGVERCIDSDGDGYGKYCSDGLDCNDKDPDVTDECTRCVNANTDCPCERGVMPKFCTPKNKEGDGGTFMCTEGTRYCRDGFWSACEAVGNYVFVPNK